jgi:hypothetical protein
MKTRLERDQQQMSQCVCKIPCECGRSYIAKTGRSLAMRLHEGHRVSRDETRILEIESNSRYGGYKESAHIACLTNLISQTSWDISPIWIPLTSSEVSNSQGSVWSDRFFMGIYKHLVARVSCTPQVVIAVGRNWF